MSQPVSDNWQNASLRSNVQHITSPQKHETDHILFLATEINHTKFKR